MKAFLEIFRRNIDSSQVSDEKWVPLIITYSIPEARIFRDHLEDSNIPVWVREERSSGLPIGITGPGALRVLVHEADLEKAHEATRHILIDISGKTYKDND